MAGSRVMFQVSDSTLGEFLVAQCENSICALFFIGSCGRTVAMNDLKAAFPRSLVIEGNVRFVEQVRSILNGTCGCSNVPIHLKRSGDFTIAVWKELLKIERGKTKTYSEVATALGRPTAYRAVARACASNVIAVIVPCHRVIASSGHLSGYRWGIEIKKKLLAMEGDMDIFYTNL
uniref:Methylated-DNA--protein-cysteine methyltransferase n=1 Tax=Heterorhabditis bacteriophora TaxID=37862 RepID=A0A1I7X7X4_HETBA